MLEASAALEDLTRNRAGHDGGHNVEIVDYH
jgi:hypothetical protein